MKSGKGNGIKEEPPDLLLTKENSTFLSEKRESRGSWKEQVSQEKKGNASIKMEFDNTQTAGFFPESSLIGVFPMAQSGCGHEGSTVVRARKHKNHSFCFLP